MNQSTGAPGHSTARLGWGFIALYALSYTGGSLLFLAPLLVSLAVKVNDLIDVAPRNLALVTGACSLLAIVSNPLFGRLSDRTTATLAAQAAVLPDQVPTSQRGVVSGVPSASSATGNCVRGQATVVLAQIGIDEAAVPHQVYLGTLVQSWLSSPSRLSPVDCETEAVAARHS